MVTPATAAAGFLLLLILTAVASFGVYRQSCETVVVSSRVRLALTFSLTAVLLLIVACKLALISAYGSSVPYLDQWNGEGTRVYQPLAHGTLQWVDLTAPHNEHRIAVMRLWNLGLILLNGQWDGLVQTTANAFLHGWLAIVLCVLLWRQLGYKYLDVIATLAIVLWALPLGWENTLVGFQAAFYFLPLFLVLPLALLPGAGPDQVRWWMGVTLLMLGLFSVATGVLNAVAVMCALVLRWRTAGPLGRSDLWAGVAACGLVALLGIALAPSGGEFAAKTLTQFGDALLAWLAWPHPEHPALAWIPWLPLMIVVARWMARRGVVDDIDATLMALGLWVLLQGGAAAYARGGGRTLPPSRYTDLLSLGIVANGVAILALFATWRAFFARPLLIALSVLWTAYIALGLSWRTQEALAFAADRGALNQTYTRNLRSFVATSDRSTLATLVFPAQTPYPNPAVLADLLTDPALSRWLPPSLRNPLPLTPVAPIAAFVPNGVYPTTPVDATRPSWGSYAAAGNLARGELESRSTGCSESSFAIIEVAGYLGADGTHLSLVDGNDRSIHVRPREPAREQWLRQYTRCPTRPFAVVARDDTPNLWFAFRPPIELGRLAFVAYQLIEAWQALMIGAVALGWIGIRLWMTPARTAAGMERAREFVREEA